MTSYNNELTIHPGRISQFKLRYGSESCYGQAAHYLFALSRNNRAATSPDITYLLENGLKFYCDIIKNGEIGTYRSIYINELERHHPFLYDCNEPYEFRAAPCYGSGKFEDVIMSQLDTSPYLTILHNGNVSAIAKVAGRYHFFDSHRNSAETGLPTRSEQGVAVYITTDKHDIMHIYLRGRYAPSDSVEINKISFVLSSEPQTSVPLILDVPFSTDSSKIASSPFTTSSVPPTSQGPSASFSDTLLISASQDTISVESSFSDVIHISASDARSSVEKRKKRERSASPSTLDACTAPASSDASKKINRPTTPAPSSTSSVTRSAATRSSSLNCAESEVKKRCPSCLNFKGHTKLCRVSQKHKISVKSEIHCS